MHSESNRLYNVHEYVVCEFRFDLCKIQTNLKEFLPLTLLNIAGGQIYPDLFNFEDQPKLTKFAKMTTQIFFCI